jgi:DNA-binding transcriptional ArsR family regulator
MSNMPPLPQVRLRNGFSDRNRIKEENKNIQYEDFDERTRITFCNTLQNAFHSASKLFEYDYRKKIDFEQTICRFILEYVYVEQVNKDAEYDINLLFKHYFYRTIKEDTYNKVLDLIEVFAIIDGTISSFRKYNKYKDTFNETFEYEFVGYRFVDDRIVAITDKNEIETIEEAIKENPYEKCRNHISKALNLLADRNMKDYSNSIKESISAVESICQIIVNEQATLGEAMKKLEENGVIIDKALKAAFEKMYGYTSNAGDIRHANAFSTEKPAFEDAKYMLVACSAFVNYLIVKIAKTEIGGK